MHDKGHEKYYCGLTGNQGSIGHKTHFGISPPIVQWGAPIGQLGDDKIPRLPQIYKTERHCDWTNDRQNRQVES